MLLRFNNKVYIKASIGVCLPEFGCKASDERQVR